MDRAGFHSEINHSFTLLRTCLTHVLFFLSRHSTDTPGWKYLLHVPDAGHFYMCDWIESATPTSLHLSTLYSQRFITVHWRVILRGCLGKVCTDRARTTCYLRDITSRRIRNFLPGSATSHGQRIHNYSCQALYLFHNQIDDFHQRLRDCLHRAIHLSRGSLRSRRSPEPVWIASRIGYIWTKMWSVGCISYIDGNDS